MQRMLGLCMGWLVAAGALGADELANLRAVGPEGAGHDAAQKAWRTVAAADAGQLPAILAGMDGAGPLAANWIATAAQAVVERAGRDHQALPLAELEALVLDRKHSPRPRRLAFEILAAADPAARARLVPRFLDDPAGELRYDAVAQLMAEAEGKAADNAREAAEVYLRALDAARDFNQVLDLANRLRKLDHPIDLPRQLGYVVRWKLIGPFDNTGRTGFQTAYPPETELRFDAAYPGKSGEVRWSDFTSDDELGTIDLFKPFGVQREVTGYAVAEFVSPLQRPVELRWNSPNATKVWLNGQLVGAYEIYHSGTLPDQYVGSVTLRPGRNTILVKVCQNELTVDWAQFWQFQLRVCDADGAAVLSEK